LDRHRLSRLIGAVERFRLGVDENGLGPRLGPLVVTAVLARVTEEGHAVASRRARGALAKRLGDSKAMIAHGDVALGEAWARAVARRIGITAITPDDLIHGLVLDTKAELRRQCPSHVEAQCWSTDGETFEAEDKLVARVTADIERLAQQGVEIVSLRSTVVCTRRINDARVGGRSRFDVDLHAMERMVLDARERHDGEFQAVCGKVGGFARYSSAFGPLAGRLHAIVEEGAKRSTYSFPGIGTIAFVRDADQSHLLVSMASMVGKWIREIMMTRIVRHYGYDEAAAELASGYHDPVTARFVKATALVRKNRKVPDTCFERTPADAAPLDPRKRAREVMLVP
jgi:ribonuclease HII